MRQTIVFDTNIFVADHDERSATWREFREYRKASDCRVCIPAVVVLELMRKVFQQRRGKALKLEKTLASIRETIQFLEGTSFEVELDSAEIAMPQLLGVLEAIKVRPSVERWREEVRELLQRLTGGSFIEPDFPEATHEEIVMRCCIEERKPFPVTGQEKDSDRAYRDTLIWLSLIAEVKCSGKDDRFVFITNNVEDFASDDKRSLHPHLLQDLSLSEAKVELCSSMEEFLGVHFKLLKEDIAMRSSLLKDEEFLSALNVDPVRIFGAVIARGLEPEPDFTYKNAMLGQLVPLHIHSVKRLSEDTPDVLVRLTASARIHLRRVVEPASGQGYPIAYDMDLADVTTAAVTYDTIGKTVKEVSIQASYADPLIDCMFNLRIERSASGSPSYVLLFLPLPAGTPAAGATTGIRLESREELNRCLRELGAPHNLYIPEEGAREFDCEPIPRSVLIKWKLVPA